MKAIHAEKCRARPTCELRIGASSWDEDDVAMKFTWFTENGQPARGGEFPIDALPQMLSMAKRHGYVDTQDRFSEIATQSARAAQMYLVLVGCAHNRQTITYGQLAKLMGYEGVGHNMGHALGCLMQWCDRHGHPRLNTLVVKRADGTYPGVPGVGVVMTVEQVCEAQALAWEYDWYDVVPPVAGDLTEPFAAA